MSSIAIIFRVMRSRRGRLLKSYSDNFIAHKNKNVIQSIFIEENKIVFQLFDNVFMFFTRK